MSKMLTFAEIKAAFGSEWILLGDPVTDDSLAVQSGTVLWHSKDRDEVYREARKLKPAHSAILYTGDVPAGAAVVL